MILASVLSMYMLFASCESAKILAYFPTPSISHQVVFRAYTDELARRGHVVTVITPDPSPDPPENLIQIDVHDSYKILREGISFVEAREKNQEVLDMLPILSNITVNYHEYQMSRPEVKEILSLDRNHFDLLVAEAIAPFSFTLANKFDAPLVGIASMTGSSFTYESMGAPTHPILYADIMRDTLVIDTIWNKLKVLYQYIKLKEIIHDGIEALENRMLEQFYGKNAKKVTEIATKVDLMILNSNPLFTGIRPVGPNTLLVNGLHLIKSNKALPEDLQNFLDSANEGVVYFSLGTNALAKDFSPDILQLFKDVFKQLPNKVVWKYELDEMEGKPDNVKIMKWVPQMELLGHKNIKAFIMQGGQQSIDEAIFNRVPIVGIPVLGDQDLNIQRVIHHGLGVGLNLNTITREQLLAAVHRVIEDKSYKERITKFSEILEDQPEPPLERAIWWTEYVIRHKGAPHLRSPAAGISDWEYFMMDVVLLILGFIVFVIIIFAFVIRKILCSLKGHVVSNKKIQ